MAEYLTDLGMQVVQAVDGVAALQLLEKTPGLALLLSDIKMPRLNGHELAEKALQLQPELKVLLMTGYVGELPTPRALLAREIRTITKPVALDRLREVLEEMLSRP